MEDMEIQWFNNSLGVGASLNSDGASVLIHYKHFTDSTVCLSLSEGASIRAVVDKVNGGLIAKKIEFISGPKNLRQTKLKSEATASSS